MVGIHPVQHGDHLGGGQKVQHPPTLAGGLVEVFQQFKEAVVVPVEMGDQISGPVIPGLGRNVVQDGTHGVVEIHIPGQTFLIKAVPDHSGLFRVTGGHGGLEKFKDLFRTEVPRTVRVEPQQFLGGGGKGSGLLHGLDLFAPGRQKRIIAGDQDAGQQRIHQLRGDLDGAVPGGHAVEVNVSGLLGKGPGLFHRKEGQAAILNGGTPLFGLQEFHQIPSPGHGGKAAFQQCRPPALALGPGVGQFGKQFRGGGRGHALVHLGGQGLIQQGKGLGLALARRHRIHGNGRIPQVRGGHAGNEDALHFQTFLGIVHGSRHACPLGTQGGVVHLKGVGVLSLGRRDGVGQFKKIFLAVLFLHPGQGHGGQIAPVAGHGDVEGFMFPGRGVHGMFQIRFQSLDLGHQAVVARGQIGPVGLVVAAPLGDLVQEVFQGINIGVFHHLAGVGVVQGFHGDCAVLGPFHHLHRHRFRRTLAPCIGVQIPFRSQGDLALGNGGTAHGQGIFHKISIVRGEQAVVIGAGDILSQFVQVGGHALGLPIPLGAHPVQEFIDHGGLFMGIQGSEFLAKIGEGNVRIQDRCQGIDSTEGGDLRCRGVDKIFFIHGQLGKLGGRFRNPAPLCCRKMHLPI